MREMGYISETKLVVRYAETDMMGIVHHSRYYPWFEVARTDFIKHSGLTYSQMEQMGVLMPLVETGAKYIHGLTYEDEIIVRAYLTELGVAKCSFGYDVIKLPEEKLMATGKTVHGFVDKEFKPMNLKKKFPEVFEALSKLL